MRGQKVEFEAKYLSARDQHGTSYCPQGHGGHSLVARGLYALQLEKWLQGYELVASSDGRKELVASSSPAPNPRATSSGKSGGKSGDLMVVKMESLVGKGAENGPGLLPFPTFLFSVTPNPHLTNITPIIPPMSDLILDHHSCGPIASFNQIVSCSFV